MTEVHALWGASSRLAISIELLLCLPTLQRLSGHKLYSPNSLVAIVLNINSALSGMWEQKWDRSHIPASLIELVNLLVVLLGLLHSLSRVQPRASWVVREAVQWQWWWRQWFSDLNTPVIRVCSEVHCSRSRLLSSIFLIDAEKAAPWMDHFLRWFPGATSGGPT